MRQMIRSTTTALRRDPAPSRLNYRLQRLMLTPMIRRLLRVGLPLGCVALVLAIYLSDQGRRDGIAMLIEDVKSTVRDRPEFMVKLMAIDGASAGLADDIREVMAVDFPVSSFDLDLTRMRLDVAALPAVARVDMRVRPGGVLEVDISERMPVAILRSRNGLDLVDRAGIRVAPLAARSARPDLPLIAGTGAEGAVDEALELFAAAAPLSADVRGLVRVGERRWTLVMDDNQSVLLPESGAVQALEQVIALNQVQQLLGRDVQIVDMRNPRRPTLRLSEGAAEKMREIKVMELGDD
ncbi:cell division protein FtsQ/DivIB [Oceaniglobus roseus]|uniref:cell division protein FtsQ/DivIB n=1 Tax=Oceaniglobus roseus TaxID=1737570 RepID=UPI000C7E94DB|nr:cell division protein FtsQ/DivIB [Kandeliimicrobium roseum]